MNVRGLVVLGGFAAITLAVSLGPRTAVACSRVATLGVFETSPSADSTPPILKSAKLDISRAGEPVGTCEARGSFEVSTDASDDVSEARDLGFELTLVRGTLPFKLPAGPVIGVDSFRQAGKLTDTTLDDGSDYDATVSIRVLDSAGNRSEPIEVHVSGAGDGGCSLGRRRGGQGASWTIALMLVGYALRRSTKSRQGREAQK